MQVGSEAQKNCQARRCGTAARADAVGEAHEAAGDAD